MGINSKIAKIPFAAIYTVLSAIVSYNWIRVALFQRDWEVFQKEQPWDYHLASYFSKTLDITLQQYFIFALPVILVGLYLIIKIVGKLLNLDKNTNIKGDNHVALLIILLIAPTIFDIHKLFAFGWKSFFIPGIILISLFSIWTWFDERRGRKEDI